MKDGNRPKIDDARVSINSLQLHFINHERKQSSLERFHKTKLSPQRRIKNRPEINIVLDAIEVPGTNKIKARRKNTWIVHAALSNDYSKSNDDTRALSL